MDSIPNQRGVLTVRLITTYQHLAVNSLLSYLWSQYNTLVLYSVKL